MSIKVLPVAFAVVCGTAALFAYRRSVKSSHRRSDDASSASDQTVQKKEAPREQKPAESTEQMLAAPEAPVLDNNMLASVALKPVPVTSQLPLPEMRYPESPRFDFGSAEGRALGLDYLEKHGYVVVQSVLSSEEIAQGKDLFWEWMEHAAPGVRRDDLNTWEKPAWPCDFRGIISSKGVGQSPFLWFIRSRPRVRTAFAALWDTDDLIVSFDGCNAFRPWYQKKSWRTDGGWWHVDQNPRRPDKECIQGFVSLYPAHKSVGGLCVIPDSHKTFHELVRIPKVATAGDFVGIPRSDPALQAPSVLVSCQPGDLILWDSRTIHCNTPGVADSSEPSEVSEVETEIIRLVAYICMIPTSMASSEVLQERKVAIGEGVTSTHWPHRLKVVSQHDDSKPLTNPFVVGDLIGGKSK